MFTVALLPDVLNSSSVIFPSLLNPGHSYSEVEAYLILSHFVLLHFTDVVYFLLTEGKTFHQQKEFNLLYWDTHFTVVAGT